MAALEPLALFARNLRLLVTDLTRSRPEDVALARLKRLACLALDKSPEQVLLVVGKHMARHQAHIDGDTEAFDEFCRTASFEAEVSAAPRSDVQALARDFIPRVRGALAAAGAGTRADYHERVRAMLDAYLAHTELLDARLLGGAS